MTESTTDIDVGPEPEQAPVTPLTQLVVIDPRELLDHPDNIRKGKPDVADLVESVKEVGLLEPLLVVPADDDRLMVVAGHRRKAAAIAAGLDVVECLVRFDLTAKAAAIGTMLVENDQRHDLSDAERAGAYQTLLDLGEEAGRIGRLGGVSAKAVEAAAALTAKKKAHGIALKHDLGIEDALILAEFEDDKEALKDLAVVAIKEPEMLAHRASRIRKDRETEAATAESKAKAKELGLALTDFGPRYDAKTADPNKVSGLVHKDLTPVTDDEADLAWIDHDGSLVLMVANPKERGFRKPPSANAAPKKERTEEDKERMRETIANNKAWPAASEVRLAFVKALVQRRTAPKGMLAFTLASHIIDTGLARDVSDPLIEDWYGPPKGKSFGATALRDMLDAPDPRLTVVAFAQIASALEWRMREKDGWRVGHGHQARYLGFLQSVGYQPSELEASLIGPADPKAKKAATKAA